jgi:hypothetical protein
MMLTQSKNPTQPYVLADDTSQLELVLLDPAIDGGRKVSALRTGAKLFPRPSFPPQYSIPATAPTNSPVDQV